MRPAAHNLAMTCAVAVWAIGLAGCAYSRLPRIDPSGERIFLPPEPVFDTEPVGERQWDNVGVHVTPSETIAPVGSEVVLVASVVGRDGYTSTNERVEWTVAPGSAGQIVQVGQGTYCDWIVLDFLRPRKVNSTWAVGKTSRKYTRLTRESEAEGDDVLVQAGQTWVSVTCPTEGTSQVTAYAPSVFGWDRHRATATIHWVDAQWTFPAVSHNPAGSRHLLTTTVHRHSDLSPLAGWIVRYEIAGGPAAGFAPDGSQAVEVAVNELGQASVEMLQAQPAPGTNVINVQIIRPAELSGPGGKRLVVARGSTTKTWSAPQLAVRKSGPAAVAAGATFRYTIEVSNPGDQPADAVVVADRIPDGAALVGTNPAAQVSAGLLQWQLGQLGPGQAKRLEVELRAERLGPIESCVDAAAAGGLKARDCVTTTATAPGVELRVSGPRQVQVGDPVTFEILASNRGQVAAADVVIRDQFEPGLEHEAATGAIERPLGNLAPGQELRLRVTFRAARAGRLCHTVELLSGGSLVARQQACVTAVAPAEPPPREAPVQPGPAPKPVPKPQPKPEPKIEPRPAPPTGPAVSVRKSGPTSAAVGEMVLFRIDVENTGTEPLTSVRILDQCDRQLEPRNATRGFEQTDEGVELVIDRIPVGGRAALQVQCLCVEAAAQTCNRVRVSTAEGARDRAEACLAVTGEAKPKVSGPGLSPPELSIEVTDLKDPVRVDDSVTYRITVTNRGQTADTGVIVGATLPPQLVPDRLGTAGPAKSTIDGRNVRFETVTQIRPGETLTYRIKALATAPIEGAELVVQAIARSLDQPITARETTRVIAKVPGP